MLKESHPSVLAQPLADREWQVVAGDWDQPHGGRVVGFIEELGGTYEVDVVDHPSLRQFFDTFKDAMEFFEHLAGDTGGDTGGRGSVSVGSQC